MALEKEFNFLQFFKLIIIKFNDNKRSSGKFTCATCCVMEKLSKIGNQLNTITKPKTLFGSGEYVQQFLKQLGQQYHLHTPNDWNSITTDQIKQQNGTSILHQYSLYELKCLACPEGKLIFTKPKQSKGYWNNKENILKFLHQIKEKYNFQSIEDWNLLSVKQIEINGGSFLLKKYSLYELKCLACPEGKLIFTKPKHSKEYWNNKENILQFLHQIKEKYNFQSIEDWNSLTKKQIQINGGNLLLQKYSLYELKCFACPEGKLIFNNKSNINWNENSLNQFFDKLREKYHLKTPNDWVFITNKDIKDNGGGFLLHKYSMYELKCLACPDGKFLFNKPHSKGFWNNKDNIIEFLNKMKVKYNLHSPDDWNQLNQKDFQFNGGNSLLQKYSLYELKCLACPEGKFLFDKSNPYKSLEYWNNKENQNKFFEKLKHKFHLISPLDWKRVSTDQIRSQGGNWLFYSNNYFLDKIFIDFDIQNNDNHSGSVSFLLKDLLASNYKRSSQRWLFLQIQKLFPDEEIVEDYFHSEISRESGFAVQFDIFMIDKKIAIEYHGIQHYEDIPSGFAPLEMNSYRDVEKKTLCKKYGIHLIVIPYWWDNKLDSLKETLANIDTLNCNSNL